MVTRFNDLPGTSPNFHSSHNYLTSIRYKGREMLASHGSCRETGCNYSSAWTSNEARDRGMWKHRAEKVAEARVSYFRKLTNFNPKKAQRLLDETADHNVILFDKWMVRVQSFLSELAGEDIPELPKGPYQVRYMRGVGAMDMAKEILARAAAVKAE